MYNPYAVLGVKSTQSKEEIKVAYRAKARKCHPDVGGNAEEFQRISKAWDYINKNHQQVSAKREYMWVHSSLFNVHKEDIKC